MKSISSNSVSSKPVNESLSALVDDEQNDIDFQRLLRTVDDEQESEALRATYARYQSYGALMRNETSSLEFGDISSAVRAAIEDEAAPKRPFCLDVSQQLSGERCCCSNGNLRSCIWRSAI